MRRILSSLAAAAIALSLIPGHATNVDIGDVGPTCPPPATMPPAPPPGYDCQKSLMIPVNVDGARLDATFYWPDPMPAAQVPAILMTHGYGGWHRSGGDIGNAVMLAKAGYAVLAYTSRGFGRSEGQVELESPEGEVRDAQDLITWLATPANTGNRVLLDSAGDPRIGMFGGSYAGGIQLLTASRDTRLDAITPQITWNDLRYSLSPNGVIKHGWIDLLYASGKYAGYLGPVGGAPVVVSTESVPRDQDIQVLTSYLANDSVTMPVAYSDGTYSSYDYLARRSVAGRIGYVHAATFLIQGQRDTLFTMNEALRTFSGLDEHMFQVPKKLLMYSAGHGYSDIVYDADPNDPDNALVRERDAINQKILAWFDRYLNGNTSADTGPQVEAWLPWVTDTNGVPLPNFATPVGSSVLAPSLAGPATVLLSNAVAPTSNTETTNFQPRTGSPAIDAASGVTSQDYTYTPSSAISLFGVPVAHFTISSEAPEAIVFAKLWDVGPSGRTLVHRLVTPARVRGGVGDFCTGYIPGPTISTFVQPTAVCLPLAGITWQFDAGHSLLLTLATSDSMYFGSRYPGVYQISNVSLDLPVVSSFTPVP